MQTETEESKKPKTLTNPENLKGRWKLTYKLVNYSGIKGFSGKTISTYSDPLTGKPRHYFDASGNFNPGFLIDKTVMFFDPSNNPEHRLIVDWLIGHPDVGIEQEHVKIHNSYLARKASNPRIKLVNLDHVEVKDIEEEDFIDKLIGRISQDTGATAIGLEKIRFVLSALGRPYFEAKYMTDRNKEKQVLRKSLKDFTRSSVESALEVERVLNDLDNAKIGYEIKEMRRLAVLTDSNGMYKYNGFPVGSATESIVKYFMNNSEIYEEAQTRLYQALKDETSRAVDQTY